MTLIERPAGEGAWATPPRAWRARTWMGIREHRAQERGSQAPCRDGSNPKGIAGPYGHQAWSRTGDRCLQETARGRGEQVRSFRAMSCSTRPALKWVLYDPNTDWHFRRWEGGGGIGGRMGYWFYSPYGVQIAQKPKWNPRLRSWLQVLMSEWKNELCEWLREWMLWTLLFLYIYTHISHPSICSMWVEYHSPSVGFIYVSRL